MTAAELKAWRQQHGLSIRKMAAKLGVSPSTIDRWERAHIALPAYLGLAIAGLEQQEDSMDRRAQQINAIALRIYEATVFGELPTRADVQRTNDDEGWTVDLPTDPPRANSWLRYSGVQLSPDELDRAYAQAEHDLSVTRGRADR